MMGNVTVTEGSVRKEIAGSFSSKGKLSASQGSGLAHHRPSFPPPHPLPSLCISTILSPRRSSRLSSPILSFIFLILTPDTSYHDHHGRCMLSATGTSRLNSQLSLPVFTLVQQPIDFDGDVNLFHFVLLRCVGKGAFGKVRSHSPLSSTR